MDALRIIFYFTLLIGPLVLFHELGHFLAARYFGVKCTEFAIGFGPRIFSWKPGETEFTFRILPLGGFVRMVGEHDESQDPRDKGRAVTDKPLWQRAVIFVAGPLVNLVIPIPVFFVFLMMAPGVLPPVIGSVEPDFPAAQAGLEPGDRVISIDGKAIDTFEQFQRRVSKSAGEELTLVVDRQGATHSLSMTPNAVAQRHPILPMRIRERGLVGVHLTQYGPVLHVADEHSPAAQAGLRHFDTIVSVDGQPVRLWSDVRAALRQPGVHELLVMRPERTTDTWADVRLRHPLRMKIESGDLEDLGLETAQQTIWSVTPGSPAAQAGLQAGDRILRIDDREQGEMSWILSQLSVGADTEHTLSVERSGELFDVKILPESRNVVAEFRSAREEVFIGFKPYPAMQYPALEELPVGKKVTMSLVSSVRDTFSVISSLVMGVAMLFTGQVDSNSVGGPLMIADVASQAARDGVHRFIGIMALISVNLGVLNLLPIPGLDGGQLAVVGLEAVNRGPLSSRTRQIIHFVGLVMLLLLMLFVFKNDIERYWRSVADWLNA